MVPDPERQARDPSQARLKREILAELDKHPFAPPWWLRNRHLQTIWSAFLRPSARLPAKSERLATPDGDWLRIHHLAGDAACPTVLLLHGLEGSLRSHYVGGLARALRRHRWRVVVLEFRSCSGEMNQARRLYHSGETSDLDFVVRQLVDRDPTLRIYVAGVSLGGNVTAKWLGEGGSSLPGNVVAAAALSPPFDLTVAGPFMDRALGGLYTRWFLRTLIPKALAKERQYPGSLDPQAVRRSRTFEEFDTHATAALHGFRDAYDYYASVGCGQFLTGIRRPTLLIAAADDPMSPASALPRETAQASPYIYPQFPARGGHVGFVYGPHPLRLRHWAEEQIVRFFRAVEQARTSPLGASALGS